MSDFYNELALYYDDLFPTGMAQVQLITETAGRPPRTVLDVACGNGSYATKLHAMGYAVTAIDHDDGMIWQLTTRDTDIQAS